MSTYQIHHPEIGFDPFWINYWENMCEQPRKIGPIGPHGYRDMGLMLAGVKPCALVGREYWDDEWKINAQVNNWYVNDSIRFAGSPGASVFVSLPDEQWRMLALMMTYEFSEKAGKMLSAQHVVIGRLLGYRQSDIDIFCDRLSKMERRQEELESHQVDKHRIHRILAKEFPLEDA